jgi:hypothetical protein
VNWIGSPFDVLDLNWPWERLENIRECAESDEREVYLIALVKLGELLQLAWLKDPLLRGQMGARWLILLERNFRWALSEVLPLVSSL